MKRGLLFISLIFLAFVNSARLQAQTVGDLYSLVYFGGVHWGTFNIFDPIADTDYAAFDFLGPNGIGPYGNLVQTKTGLLYGMTSYGGGTYNAPPLGGVLFSYDIRKKVQTVIYDFNGVNDTSQPFVPYGTLLLATDSNYYGLAYEGGYWGSGTIFRFNPGTNTVQNVYTMFGRNIGFNPTGNLIQVNDSLLYGMGDYSKGMGPGTIFSFNINTDLATELYVFTGTSGNYPRGSLLKVNDTMLYGLTQSGGTSSLGVIFSYNIRTNVETVLHNFTGSPDGANPGGSLIMAKDGYLYGTTENGGEVIKDSGTLFRYNIDSNTVTILYSFGRRSGWMPYGDVIQATDGKLYGNTNLGGKYGRTGVDTGGTIFSYDISTKTETTLYNYNALNGEFPYGNFLEVMSASDSIVNNKCPNDSSGSITIYTRGAIPPLTYHWSNGATTSSITGLKSGIDSGWVSDSRGITFAFIDTIGPGAMTIKFNISNPCTANDSGSAFANVTGGLQPYTFHWSNGDTTDTATGLPVGTYTFSLADAHGCTGSASVVITQGTPVVLDSIHVISENLYPYNSGEIIVTVQGGIPPGDSICYYYLWYGSNGNIGHLTKYHTDTISQLDSGSYSVCVTSCYNCGSVCSDTVQIFTGTNNLTTAGQIKVYPVPSTGQISIELKGSGYNYLEITDALGRNVYAQNLGQDSSNKTLSVNLSNLPNGLYILRINSQNTVLTSKIVIQK